MANEVTRLIKEAAYWTAQAEQQAVQLKALEAEVEVRKSLHDAEKQIWILEEKRRHYQMLLDHSLQERRPQDWRQQSDVKSPGSCCFSKDFGNRNFSPMGTCLTGTCSSARTRSKASLAHTAFAY
ncbi:hypothetical protein HPB47_005191 [Ixodes persulcatus]|uniref:Uncharacterized protein n=1 Tax=Ixodes persulcatus TaxID=34615 RepID=A0AC60PEB3_IXOPE|nr:hypothetical protein HPB47_005191 [Ixodes persulcatus]